MDNTPKTQITESGRWLISISVMLVTVMEVLDMTIVNVAMPNMMGALSASADQITWVLTSYIVAAAIMMPLTGFFINRFGCKKILLLNIVGFLISSMLCGLSTSLIEIVVFRICQGVFGAALVPLSQFILRNTFPPEDLTKAMAIWGVGIMTGPVLGPTIGGYITDTFNWRWIFYINIPVCFIAFFMCWKLITETPIKYIKTDWPGIILMAVTIGALQLFLDRGNTVDWFSASSIRWLFGLFIVGLIVFIWRGLKTSHHIINLSLFANRNFALGCTLLAIFCASMFGMLALQPLLMENYMNYTSSLAGLVMAPRGIASAFAMALVPKLMKKLDLRTILFIGILCCIIGTYEMAKINLEASTFSFIWTGAIQGFGMGFFFVPVSNLTFATLGKSHYAEASGLFSFWRSLGQSIGISLLSTLVTRETQTNWNVLNSHIQPFNPALKYWLAEHHQNLHSAITLQQLTQQISSQASVISFLDGFTASMLGFVVMLPLVLFLQKPKKPAAGLMPE